MGRKSPQFHMALPIDYPRSADRERARKPGVKPGGDIEIHGLTPKFAWLVAARRQVNWTDGSIALTNTQIEEMHSRW